MSVMKTKTAEEVGTYESLLRIQLGFAQVVDALESLQQHKSYRGSAMQAAARAVREARAGTLFEVLEILREREERKWTRLGRPQNARGH